MVSGRCLNILLAGLFQILPLVAAFVGISSPSSHSSGIKNIDNESLLSYRNTAISAEGFGGGVNTAGSKTKKNNNKKSVSSTPFDAKASLRRLEKKYDELCKANARRLHNEVVEASDDIVTSEYVVAVRPRKTSTYSKVISDWVPVGQLLMAREHASVIGGGGSYDHAGADQESKLLLHHVVSYYRRELAQLAVLGSRLFSKVPHNELEYSVEASDSFYKYVYDIVFGSNPNDGDISDAEARQILGLEVNREGYLDRSTLRKTYRTLSMEWHPDRMVGESEERQQEAAARYSQIKQAYETLMSSGSTESWSSTLSWYESLGGRQRNDFIRIEAPLVPIDIAQQTLQMRKVEIAVAGFSTELVQGFVFRSSIRSRR